MIGEVLKIVRKANFMTVEQASIKSGISKPYLSELERGKKINISEEYLTKLSSAYNLQPYQLRHLINYYTKLEVEKKRRLRLTLMKALEMIENNLYPEANN